MKSPALSAQANARSATNHLPSVAAVACLIVGINVLLVGMTGYAKYDHAPAISYHLNLGIEHNAAVWWATVTMLLAGWLCLAAAKLNAEKRTAMLVLCVLFLGLSLDEVGSLHERIGESSFLAFIPFAVIGGILFSYSFVNLHRDPATRGAARLFVAGFICFGSIVVQEFLEHAVDWPYWAIGLRVSVEEGVEVMGTFLCILAAYRCCATADVQAIAKSMIESIDRTFFVALLAVHSVASLVAPALSGYPGQGNPAVWVPIVFLFIAAVIACIHASSEVEHRIPNVLIALIAVLGSIAVTYYRFPDTLVMKLLIVILPVLLIVVASVNVHRRHSWRWACICLLPTLICLSLFAIYSYPALLFLFAGIATGSTAYIVFKNVVIPGPVQARV